MAIPFAPDSPPGEQARRTARDHTPEVPGRESGRESGRVAAIRGWSALARVAIAALAPVGAGVALLALWQVGITVSGISAYLVPAPLAVFQSFIVSTLGGLIPQYALTTLEESLVGFVLGAVIALPLGYAVARSRALAAVLEPYLAASQAVPAVALGPLLILWLGFGLAPVAALCALIVFFPAAINTTLGFRTLNRDILDAARIDGAGWWNLLWHVELPLASPSILSGLRASLTLSVTGAVVGEFLLGDRGLGGLLTIARGNFETPLAFATLLALALLAIGLYGLARLVERLTISKFALEA